MTSHGPGRWLSRARRLSLFALAPLLASFAPIFALSAVAHGGGREDWLGLLVGQSVGSVACLIITWGWDIGGPARTASAPPARQLELLALSLVSRGTIAAVGIPVAAGLTALLSMELSTPVAVLACVAAAAQGLSLNWWFVATGRPRGIVLTDAIPRCLAVAAAVAAISLARLPAVVYPLLLLTAVSASYGVSYLRLLRGVARVPLGSAVRSLVADRRLALSAIATTAYTSGTLPLVQAVAPAAAVVFGAAQRIASYWSFSTAIGGNAAQHWVNQPGPAGLHRRARVAMVLFSAQGLVLGAALWLLGPWVAEVILATTGIPSAVAACFGIGHLAVSMSTVAGRLYLIPLGHERTVSRATVVTCLVGVPALILGAITWGALGAAAAVAGAEVLATALLVGAALRAHAVRHAPQVAFSAG